MSLLRLFICDQFRDNLTFYISRIFSFDVFVVYGPGLLSSRTVVLFAR